MKIKTILILIVLFSTHHQASGQANIIGARSTGIGGVSTTLTDLWSSFNNQAGMADLTTIEAGIAYETRFALKELSTKSFAVVLPTKSGVFGFVASTYGFSDFLESKYGISYGRLLGENIRIGIQLNYQNLRLPSRYGNRSNLSGEIGLLTNITDKLTMGAHITNPVRLPLTENPNEYIMSTIKIGSQYQFSKKVMVAMEVRKATDFEFIFNAGIEYLVNENIILRGGTGTGPVKSNFGFGYATKKLKIDVAVWYHQLLGFSPNLSLSYALSKSSRE